MAIRKNSRPRPNRYKKQKSGRGSFTLAAFIVMIIALIAVMQLFKTERPKPIASQPIMAPAEPEQTPPPEELTNQPYEDHDGIQEQYLYEFTDNLPPETIQPPTITRPEERVATGRLAIIIDDMGSSLEEAKLLASIGVPLNFAIIPGLRHDKAVADFAASNGIELLIHIPMQPKGYPERRLESNGLLLSHNDQELQQRVNGYLERIPQAVGANNHMGSEFTENINKMKTVLKRLKTGRLFFIDSVTTPNSVAEKVAAEINLPMAKRNIFLDNEQDETYITGQLMQAVRHSLRTGQAIAICHPHPVTIATLAQQLPKLAGEGVNLVYVSNLVKEYR